MAAPGYTPILLYGSQSAGHVPSASNLSNGPGGSEIAINVIDGLLYYKDGTGTVQLIGAKIANTLAAALQYAPMGTGAVVLTGAVTAPSPNLLANGSAEFGSLDWTLPSQATYATGTYGDGTFFAISSAVNGTYVAFSADYAIAPAVALTLQAEVFASGLSAGQLIVDLEFLDASYTVIAATQAPLIVSADQGWTFMYNVATTPANTAYWRARFYMLNATLANGAVRKIKVSGGTVASPYSREADFPAIPTNFAALNGNSGQVFNVATATTGTEAVSLGQAQADFAAIHGSPYQGFNVGPAVVNSTNAPQILQTLGAGASAYTDQTASRAIGTLYTNTTGRPLYVAIVAEITLPPVSTPTVGEFTIYVNSTLVQRPSICSTFSTSTTFTLTATCVVPPGATYLMGSGLSPTILNWWEF